jgi:hypothetical protein
VSADGPDQADLAVLASNRALARLTDGERRTLWDSFDQLALRVGTVIVRQGAGIPRTSRPIACAT